MRLSSRLILVKYALKSGALRRMPEFYWCMRRLLKGLDEPGLALLTYLADRKRAAFEIGANFGTWSAAMLRISAKSTPSNQSRSLPLCLRGDEPMRSTAARRSPAHAPSLATEAPRSSTFAMGPFCVAQRLIQFE